MSGALPILAHIMGIPVEETVLFGLPPVTAAFSAWWAQRRAKRAVRAEGEADAARSSKDSAVHPGPFGES